MVGGAETISSNMDPSLNTNPRGTNMGGEWVGTNDSMRYGI